MEIISFFVLSQSEESYIIKSENLKQWFVSQVSGKKHREKGCWNGTHSP